jgi:hypothetical protein
MNKNKSFNRSEAQPPHGSPYLPESVVLRCVASCVETSEYYAGKGNHSLAGWWFDRAEMCADRLTVHRRAGLVQDPDAARRS